jgi:hypothetical protein
MPSGLIKRRNANALCSGRRWATIRYPLFLAPVLHLSWHLCVTQINEWANIVLDFAKTYGLADSVMTLDELSQGDDVRGTGNEMTAERGGPLII